MSLNGLDHPNVKEAHDAAVAEPGGWFLLKYANRDEVELLGRGNGGIVEIRENITQQEGASPLYGFLRYRRRNVLIKYIPEECSRLVQARASVHFNSICEHFAPYDTDFSITNPKELKDTKLSAACSLHAASGSTSSSTSSLRRRRLVEITEEEEEEERERKRQSVVKEEERPRSSFDRSQDGPTSGPPVRLNADLANSPEATHFGDEAGLPSLFLGAPLRPSSPTNSLDDPARRMSSQSLRPELYGYSSSIYGKPKVKLGPRPSADLGGRPRTSAGNATYRPVSSIPAGFKPFHSKNSKKDRPQGQGEDEPQSPIKEEAGATLLPVPTHTGTEPTPSEGESAQPPTSSEAQVTNTSIFNLQPTFPIMPSPATKQNTMTPEKARLLKAMKLREKKKKMSSQPLPNFLSVDAQSEPNTPGLIPQSLDVKASTDTEEIGETGDVDEVSVTNSGHPEHRKSISKADSGIGIDIGADQASVDTHTDSHPASPVAASSEIGDSTKASSLSESTDETVLAFKEQDLPGDKDDDSSPAAQSLPEIEDKRTKEPTPEPENEARPALLEKVIEKEPETAPEQDQTRVEQAIEPVEAVAPANPISPKTEDVPSVLALPISKFSKASSASRDQEKVGDIPETPETELILQATVYVPEPSPVKEDTAVEAVQEKTAQSPKIQMPVSKFSTQETKSPTSPVNPIPAIVTHASEMGHAPTTDQGTTVEDKRTEASEKLERVTIETKRSRPNTLEPIRTGLVSRDGDKRNSVMSLSDDDGLMDELQSATLHHAQPITVSKSPISPFFSNDLMIKRTSTAPESTSSAPRPVRTVSSPMRGSHLTPADAITSAPRAASSGAAYLQKVAAQQGAADLKLKNSKIGSSISQRIKALEKLSSTTDAASPKERPASAFFSVRKTSVRAPSKSPSEIERTSSIKRAKTPKSPSSPESGESSPDAVNNRRRSGSLVNRLSMFEGGKPPRGRPDSVQVTARIVRDPTQPFPKAPEQKADPADFEPLDLKQSPLLVDLQRPPSSGVEVKQSLLQRRFSKEGRSGSRDRTAEGGKEDDKEASGSTLRPRRRSSMTIVKDFIKDSRDTLRGGKSPSTDNLNLVVPSSANNLASPDISPSRAPSVHHNNSFARRLSISSRRSSLDQQASSAATSGLAPIALSPSYTTEGSDLSEAEGRPGSINGGSAATSPSPTKSTTNRASRFIRRLSNSLGTGRKAATPSISPTVAEEDDAEVAAAGLGTPLTNNARARASSNSQQPSIVALMGDVNVQFPDNLLWKRRALCLDSQGFLILSAVQGAAAVPSTAPGKDRHHQAGSIKRYHMSDFKPPYTPEMELQELPNSVVLDFVDGSGLQVACEDRAGQLNVLHSESSIMSGS
ncbi:hypothetical protein B0T22DRAFT_5720 [Podospora appendiculata]|uniref:ADF-H domain-containing protein n=1 Tax=Podospora appendiculata TaxID=314037 RepID=A0AAE1CF10_9PEZI|nr:hypothetical protein B0T22DRAFT_5720 [Podospora appendiculata]